MPVENDPPVPIGIAIRADGVICPVKDFRDFALMVTGWKSCPSIVVPAYSALVLHRHSGSGWNAKACRVVEDGDGIIPSVGIYGDAIVLFVGSPSRQVYRELLAAYS